MIVDARPIVPTFRLNARILLSHWPIAAVGVSVMLGVMLRVLALVRNPAFWGDEAMLALNVVHRSYGGLLTPLDLNQGAPIGYLLLVKLLTQLFGPHEWVMRLPSLVMALVAIPLVARVAHQELSQVGARFAVVLFALAPHAVGYAGEFKQYGVDLGIAVILLAIGQTAWLTQARGAYCRLTVAGMVAVWFSHPAVFVLAGVGAALCIQPGRWRARILVGMAWLMSFMAVYLLFTRHLGNNRYLNDYWAGLFWPVPPSEPGDLAWLIHHAIALFDLPAGFHTTGFGSEGLAAALAAVALLRLWQTRPALTLALGVPFLGALIASGLGKYPFGGRLMLFAVPALMLMVGEGMALVASRLATIHRLAPWVVALALVAPLCAELARLARVPEHAEDVRGAMEVIARHQHSGDPIVTTGGSLPATAYYAPQLGFAPHQVTSATDAFPRSNEAQSWVLVAHTPREQVGELRARLSIGGRVDTVWQGTGAELWHYTPVAPSQSATSPPAWPDAACSTLPIRVGSEGQNAESTNLPHDLR